MNARTLNNAIRMLAAAGLAGLLMLQAAHAQQADRNRAPGFSAMARDAQVVLMPTDIELFSISAGGVTEPRADWTEAATRHFKTALQASKSRLGIRTRELSEKDADDLEDINALHGAVARAIAMHHFGPGFMNLPTKEGRLDWSMGEAVAPVKQLTGADYALFTWVRDSYASAERVATMVALALIGVGVTGGFQTGYASLVDLNSGRVVWFNQVFRAAGDLRQAAAAEETLDTLLKNFPSVQ